MTYFLHFILTNVLRGSCFCSHFGSEELWSPGHGGEKPGVTPGSLTPKPRSYLPTTLFLKLPDHSERGIKQTTRTTGEMKEAWWSFHYLDNNRRQEPKRMAGRHLEHLAQGITQVWIWSHLIRLEVHQTKKHAALRNSLSYTELLFLQSGIENDDHFMIYLSTVLMPFKRIRASCWGNYMYFPTFSSNSALSVWMKPT